MIGFFIKLNLMWVGAERGDAQRELNCLRINIYWCK